MTFSKSQNLNQYQTDTVLSSEKLVDRRGSFIETLTGYFAPPYDGRYRFRISANDEAKVYFSTSANPDDKELIIELSESTPTGDFFSLDEQISDWFDLEEGQYYYIEQIHHKISAIDDHFVVGVEVEREDDSEHPLEMTQVQKITIKNEVFDEMHNFIVEDPPLPGI